jgi:hypothetical protein
MIKQALRYDAYPTVPYLTLFPRDIAAMRTTIARCVLFGLTAVLMSGCYSNGRWSMPSMSSWRSSPFQQAPGAAPGAVGAAEKPSGIAANNGATSPSPNYSSTTIAKAATPDWNQANASNGSSLAGNAPRNSYPAAQYPYPSTSTPGSPTSTASVVTPSPAYPNSRPAYNMASNAGIPGASAFGSSPSSDSGAARPYGAAPATPTGPYGGSNSYPNATAPSYSPSSTPSYSPSSSSNIPSYSPGSTPSYSPSVTSTTTSSNPIWNSPASGPTGGAANGSVPMSGTGNGNVNPIRPAPAYPANEPVRGVDGASAPATYDRPVSYDRPAGAYDRPAAAYDRPAAAYDSPASYDRAPTYDRPAPPAYGDGANYAAPKSPGAPGTGATPALADRDTPWGATPEAVGTAVRPSGIAPGSGGAYPPATANAPSGALGGSDYGPQGTLNPGTGTSRPVAPSGSSLDPPSYRPGSSSDYVPRQGSASIKTGTPSPMPSTTSGVMPASYTPTSYTPTNYTPSTGPASSGGIPPSVGF